MRKDELAMKELLDSNARLTALIGKGRWAQHLFNGAVCIFIITSILHDYF